ncbi:TPA: DUF905 domain-containing protein [Escherichia coli]|nr:DUF905 domain-containing protein [Escherichia coli]
MLIWRDWNFAPQAGEMLNRYLISDGIPVSPQPLSHRAAKSCSFFNRTQSPTGHAPSGAWPFCFYAL